MHQAVTASAPDRSTDDTAAGASPGSSERVSSEVVTAWAPDRSTDDTAAGAAAGASPGSNERASSERDN